MKLKRDRLPAIHSDGYALYSPRMEYNSFLFQLADWRKNTFDINVLNKKCILPNYCF